LYVPLGVGFDMQVELEADGGGQYGDAVDVHGEL